MSRPHKLIKGKRYQIGRFAGKWYVADLSANRFIYGPFSREATALSRLKKLAGRISPPPIQRKNPGKMPTPRTARYSKYRVNGGKKVLIYGHVLKIFAQKTDGPYKGERFVHTFKRGAKMYGMPDGSLRIEHP